MAKSLEDTVPPEVFAAASYIRDWFPESAVFIGGVAINFHCMSLDGFADLTNYTHDLDIFISRSAFVDLVDLEVVIPNARLSKSQFTKFGIEVDVYVEGKSALAVDFNEIMPFSEKVHGFRAASLEHLLVLKGDAWRNRAGSDKGQKDEMDICLILLALARKGCRMELLSCLSPDVIAQLDRIFSMRNLIVLFSGNSHTASTAWKSGRPTISAIRNQFDGIPLPPIRP